MANEHFVVQLQGTANRSSLTQELDYHDAHQKFQRASIHSVVVPHASDFCSRYTVNLLRSAKSDIIF